MSTSHSTTEHDPDAFVANTRRAAQNVNNSPNYPLRQLGAAGAVAGVAGAVAAGVMYGPAVVESIVNPKPAAVEMLEVGSDEFMDALEAAASQPADPLDIQESFRVPDRSEDGWLVTEANSIAVNLDGYEENQDVIDFTINQSALDQGVYQPNEEFAVTAATIGGRETYIVQRVAEDEAIGNKISPREDYPDPDPLDPPTPPAEPYPEPPEIEQPQPSDSSLSEVVAPPPDHFGSGKAIRIKTR